MSSVRFDTDNLAGKIGVILLYRLRIKKKQKQYFLSNQSRCLFSASADTMHESDLCVDVIDGIKQFS